MPATDPILVVLQRLVTLVSASADFWTAMRAGRASMTHNPVSNFIHSDDGRRTWLEATIKRQNTSRSGHAQFPAVFLAPGRGREASGAVQTFCSRTASQVMPYTFAIVGEGTDVVAIGQVAAEIETALKAAGGQLGIPATVAMWRQNGRVYDRAPRDVAGDVERRQCSVVCEVTVKG